MLGRERRVSWSMVALLGSLAGALALGLSVWLPPLLGRDSGIDPLEPGMLTVAPEAAGAVTLGADRAVRLDETGLTLLDGEDELVETVGEGSLVTAVLGRVEGEGPRRDEQVDAVLRHLDLTSVEIVASGARWSGEVWEGERRLPVTLTVRLDGSWIRLEARVPGADAVVVHLAESAAAVGRPPTLPERPLRRRAHWLPLAADGALPAYADPGPVAVAVGPTGTHRAVDLRERGRTDIHVWGESATVAVSSRKGAS